MPPNLSALADAPPLSDAPELVRAVRPLMDTYLTAYCSVSAPLCDERELELTDDDVDELRPTRPLGRLPKLVNTSASCTRSSNSAACTFWNVSRLGTPAAA